MNNYYSNYPSVHKLVEKLNQSKSTVHRLVKKIEKAFAYRFYTNKANKTSQRISASINKITFFDNN